MRRARLESIRTRVSACTKCTLCSTRKNAVPGRGSTESTVILVGEAPGRSEDEQGAPFVGRAGGILEAALDGAGIPAGSVYVTNVVKCRPPGNRRPTDGEVDACRPHLESEIAAIKPKIICVMGETALRSLLGLRGISMHRGTVIRKNGLDYFVTFHPAAAIYNRKLLPILGEDMKTLAGLIS